MKTIKFKILIVVVFVPVHCLSHTAEKYADEVLFLTNFLKMQKGFGQIVTYTCWTKHEQIHLWKALSRNGFSSSILTNNKKVLHHLKEEFQIFIIDSTCPFYANILEKAQLLKLFKHPHKWIILGETANPSLNPFYFGVDSEVFVIKKVVDGFQIKTIYKLTENCEKVRSYGNFTQYCTKYIENFVGIWNNKKGFLSLNTFPVPRNRSNLMGAPIIVSVVVPDNETYKYLDDYRNLIINPNVRLYWQLMYPLTAFVNATPIKVFRSTWGYRKNASGFYNGMFGDLQTRFAEIGASPAIITEERLSYLDYIGQPDKTNYKFIYRAPPLTYESNVFTLPFHKYVWYSSYCLNLLIILVLYIILLWERSDPTLERHVNEIGSILTTDFSDVVLLEVGAITQQGTVTEPTSVSGRITVMFVLLLWMFLFTSYSANIVALLQSSDQNLNTLEALLNSKIQLGVENLDYLIYYVERIEAPVKRAILHKKINPGTPNYYGLHEGIKKVREEFFGFLTELTHGYKIIGDTFHEHETCGLMELEFPDNVVTYIPVLKNTSYLKILKVGMRKIQESGIQNREQNKLFCKKPVCNGQRLAFASVGLLECYGPFFIFGIGLVCSTLMLLVEFIVRKYHIDEYFITTLGKIYSKMIHFFSSRNEVQ